MNKQINVNGWILTLPDKNGPGTIKAPWHNHPGYKYTAVIETKDGIITTGDTEYENYLEWDPATPTPNLPRKIKNTLRELDCYKYIDVSRQEYNRQQNSPETLEKHIKMGKALKISNRVNG